MFELLTSLVTREDGQSTGYIGVGTILTIVLVVVLLMILL
jgi:hypothetical protein